MEYVGSRIAHRVMLVAAVISSGIRLMWPALRTRYALRARKTRKSSHAVHISHTVHPPAHTNTTNTPALHTGALKHIGTEILVR